MSEAGELENTSVIPEGSFWENPNQVPLALVDIIDLFGFHGVAPMASRSSLERTLPRGLVLDVAAFATGFRWLMHRGYTL